MAFLLDSNVLSELRRPHRCHPNVWRWWQANSGADFFLSAITIGEIRNGVELKRRKDAAAAEIIEQWLLKVQENYAGRILPVNETVADRWGVLNCPTTLPTADSLIAATALVHDHTIATRNVGDFARTGAKVVNPFE